MTGIAPPHRAAEFEIPASLVYDSGAFAFQGQAIAAWEANNRRGILAMATGSGKTITSLIAARRALATSSKGLLIVVAAPYVPLIHQWQREAGRFGLKAVLPTVTSSRAAKLALVANTVRNVTYGATRCECLVVTHDLLSDPDFIATLGTCRADKMLVADEVHNLGTPRSVRALPEYFDYRLGLSATPERQYDPEGTATLQAYFGKVVFEFTLADAIGRCLVPYQYNVHPVPLTAPEFEKWGDLSAQLASATRQLDGEQEGDLDPRFKALLRERRLVLEQAELKLPAFQAAISQENLHELRYTLVYASDKSRDQLERINSLLMDRLHLKVHQLTYEETANGQLATALLNSFARGAIQVLTAMRVLDEGVDIPEIQKAYIVASTTVERQWVQRRGRVLRKCERIGKKEAVIHDFLVVPPVGLTGDSVRASAQSVLKGELTRAMEFAKLSKNAGDPGGPVELLTALYIKYF